MTYKKWDRVEIFWDDSYMIHGWVRLDIDYPDPDTATDKEFLEWYKNTFEVQP